MVPSAFGGCSLVFSRFHHTGGALLICFLIHSFPPASPAQNNESSEFAPNLSPGDPAEVDASESTEQQALTIREFRVVGATKIKKEIVESTLYHFTGPGRTPDDIEAARSALEKAYRDEGFQTVSVNVPPQRGRGGVIVLTVTEAQVGRLRVVGSRFFDIEKIKRRAPSLREGNVPDFNEVQKELLALNRKRDLRVTPEFRPGATPSTVDVDLVVEDTFPFHGSLELNNRYSANTKPLRLDISASYENLWQLGHVIGFGFQVAPQRPSDALIYSGYYIAPVPGVDWLSLMLNAVRQNSDVSTLGGTAVAGNGFMAGGRLIFELPSRPGFYHSASLGMDYKRFEQDISLSNGNQVLKAPITYYPLTASYTAFWTGKTYQLDFDLALTWSFRGAGSNEDAFDQRRFGSDGGFLFLKAGAGWTQDLPGGFEFHTSLQGQASGYPLVDTEQFALGGATTIRGYLEAEVVGDSAIAGTFELRSPHLLRWTKQADATDWRLFVFMDAGAAWLNDVLPEQQNQFQLWSFGFGSSLRVFERFSSSFFIGFPQVTQSYSKSGDTFLSFRFSANL